MNLNALYEQENRDRRLRRIKARRELVGCKHPELLCREFLDGICGCGCWVCENIHGIVFLK